MSRIRLIEEVTPANPSATQHLIYFKNDGLMYTLDSTGTERIITQSEVHNFLAADVNLNNVATFFTGPSCAQGAAGKWFASGYVTIFGSASDNINLRIWDGTTVFASLRGNLGSVGGNTFHISGICNAPAANIRIMVKNLSNTSGTIQYNASGDAKDSGLSVVRIG